MGLTLNDLKALADRNAILSATMIQAVQAEAASITDLQAKLAALSVPDPAIQDQINAIGGELQATVDNLTAATTAAAPTATLPNGDAAAPVDDSGTGQEQTTT